MQKQWLWAGQWQTFWRDCVCRQRATAMCHWNREFLRYSLRNKHRRQRPFVCHVHWGIVCRRENPGKTTQLPQWKRPPVGSGGGRRGESRRRKEHKIGGRYFCFWGAEEGDCTRMSKDKSSFLRGATRWFQIMWESRPTQGSFDQCE